MSDSDDDAAFASADEGDAPQATAAAVPVKSSKTNDKKNKEAENKPSTQKAQAASKPEAKGKNKKKKKGAGKKSSNAPAEQTTNTATEAKSSEELCVSEKEKDKSVDKSKSESDKKSPTTSPEVKSDSPTKPLSAKTDSELKPSTSDSKSSTPEKTDSSKVENATKIVTESPEMETITRTIDKDSTVEESERVAPSNTEEQPSGGWGWGGWGSSLLKTATHSVSTFTNQVGDGLNTLMDTVETTLGVPSPEEMVEKQKENEKKEESVISKDDKSTTEGKPGTSSTSNKSGDDEGSNETEQSEDNEQPKETKPSEETKQSEGAASGGGWFSNISHLVQNTMTEGMGVLETIGTGSLDVMEKIGKKTYSVITEHDPGFRKARQFLGNKGDKPNLSAMLRDAKEDAERKIEQDKESAEARQCHFGFLFDENQGLAHLEALEILSNQSEKKVQALLHAMPDEVLSKIKPQLLQIKDMFEIEEKDEDDEEDDHDFIKLVREQLSELNLGTTADKLQQVYEKSRKYIEEFSTEKKPDEDSETVTDEPKEVHKHAIQSLADLSCRSVEQFHKAGELILLKKDSEKSYEEKSKSLANLTLLLCSEVGILSSKFSQCLNSIAEKDKTKEEIVNPLVTNIYLEATNSSTYIQDAFQLLLPVLQHAVIQNSDVIQ